jgi:hypothetical protein
MLEILDAIIATTAVILALSLVVQAIQQIIKQLLSMKSSYMERELVMMFLDDKTLERLSKEWGTLRRKITPDWKLFGDIGADERKIVDQLKVKLQSIGYKDFEVLEKMSAKKLKAVIGQLPLFAGQDEHADGPLRDALNNVETWFDATKQAFQDHYERKMKVWALCLSAIVVIVLNADIVGIYREFSLNKTRRDAIVSLAPELLKVAEAETTATKVDTNNVKSDTGSSKISASIAVDTVKITESVNDSTLRHRIAMLDTLVTTFELVRWDTATGDSLRFGGKTGNLCVGISDFFSALVKNFIGWLAMALLVSLGAPFWYDILKTVMGIKDKLKEKAPKPAGEE